MTRTKNTASVRLVTPIYAFKVGKGKRSRIIVIQECKPWGWDEEKIIASVSTPVFPVYRLGSDTVPPLDSES